MAAAPAEAPGTSEGFLQEYVWIFVLPVVVLLAVLCMWTLQRWSRRRAKERIVERQLKQRLHVYSRERPNLAGTYALAGTERTGASGLPVWASEWQGREPCVVISVLGARGLHPKTGYWAVVSESQVAHWPFHGGTCTVADLAHSKALWAAEPHGMRLPHEIYSWQLALTQGTPADPELQFHEAEYTRVEAEVPGFDWPSDVQRTGACPVKAEVLVDGGEPTSPPGMWDTVLSNSTQVPKAQQQQAKAARRRSTMASLSSRRDSRRAEERGATYGLHAILPEVQRSLMPNSLDAWEVVFAEVRKDIGKLRPGGRDFAPGGSSSLYEAASGAGLNLERMMDAAVAAGHDPATARTATTSILSTADAGDSDAASSSGGAMQGAASFPPGGHHRSQYTDAMAAAADDDGTGSSMRSLDTRGTSYTPSSDASVPHLASGKAHAKHLRFGDMDAWSAKRAVPVEPQTDDTGQPWPGRSFPVEYRDSPASCVPPAPSLATPSLPSRSPLPWAAEGSGHLSLPYGAATSPSRRDGRGFTQRAQPSAVAERPLWPAQHSAAAAAAPGSTQRPRPAGHDAPASGAAVPVARRRASSGWLDAAQPPAPALAVPGGPPARQLGISVGARPPGGWVVPSSL